MSNPWEEIKLDDYENHMSLESVYQLQVLNEMMKEQLSAYDIESIMILGIAGGNAECRGAGSGELWFDY